MTKQQDFNDIRELLDLGSAHWGPIHREYIDNTKFSYGYGTDQWKEEVLAYRTAAKRPAEQYNIVPSFIRPFTNIIKENPPSINVYPIADGANKKVARLLSGFIRAIEYQNNAQRTYTGALTSAVRGGIGGWRVIPRANRLKRGEVDIVIEPISDMSNLIVDPNSVQPDFSDAEWFAVRNTITRKQASKDYPKAYFGDSPNEKVELIEFWCVEDQEDGEPTVNQYILSEHEILEHNTEYPSSILPLCVVTGEQYSYEGVTHYGSLTQDLKAPQREINWLKSEAIATVAQAIKASVIMDNTGLNDEELDMWARAHIEPVAALPHKSGASLTLVNPPAPPVAYMEMTNANIEICRTITGIYPDPTTQHGLNQQSGKAINYQQAGQSTATYHYVDSLKFAIKRTGEIILSLIPAYYNDNKVRLSMAHDGSFTPISMGNQEVDEATNFDMAYGQFGVTIDSGPTYASQREALINTMMDLFKVNPKAMELCMDFIVKQINLPGSEELADRFRLLLPQPIQDLIAQQEGESMDPADQLKAVMSRLQAMGQEGEQQKELIKQLTEALQHETQQLNSKEQELAIQKEIAERETDMKALIERMKLDHDEQMKRLEYEVQLAKAQYTKDQQDEKHMMDLNMAELKHQQQLEMEQERQRHDLTKSYLDKDKNED